MYLPEDIIAIMVVAEFRRRGLALQKLRRVVRDLQGKMAPHTRAVMRKTSRLYVLTEGESFYLEHAPAVMNILKQARRSMWLISVGDQFKRLAFEQTRQREDEQLKLF